LTYGFSIQTTKGGWEDFFFFITGHHGCWASDNIFLCCGLDGPSTGTIASAGGAVDAGANHG